jgi:glycosyltransferase involved in cell wall biosynthesis
VDVGKTGALQLEQLAAVIPARNEARSIRALAEACLQHVRQVIVVDDASTDGTAEALSGLPITLLSNKVRLGKGGALSRGFREALEHGAHAVVTLDGDGQHDPHDIPAFVEAANRYPGHLIIGARIKGAACAPRLRRAANRIADFWISWAAGTPICDSQSGHRLYPRELLMSVHANAEFADGFAFESELLIESTRHGFGVAAVPIETRYPGDARASYFRPAYDIWRITRMVTWKLASRAMFLSGLARALLSQPIISDA